MGFESFFFLYDIGQEGNSYWLTCKYYQSEIHQDKSWLVL